MINAPRITGIDGIISLDEVLRVLDGETTSAFGAHDAHGRCLADSERIADGKYLIAHLQLVGVAERQGGQPRSRDFDHLRHRVAAGSTLRRRLRTRLALRLY